MLEIVGYGIWGLEFRIILLLKNQNPTCVSASRVRQRHNPMPASGRAYAHCADESRKWIPLRLKPSTLEQQACPNVTRNLNSFSTYAAGDASRACPLAKRECLPDKGRDTALPAKLDLSIGLYQGIVKLS